MKHQKLLALAISSILSAGSYAAALEEVIVTAQKKAESLQDIPLAVNALAGESLSEAGIGDSLDLQIVTPGFVVNNTGPAQQMYLRGIGNRLALAGLDPSVALYMDDQYIGVAQAGQFEFADIERIEVLKGPQGTLYGRNASAGAIRVVTKGVDDEFNGKVQATLGNFNTRKFAGTVNIPLSDTFGVRLSGLSSQRDGYARNLSSEGLSEIDDGDYSAFRMKMRWDMTENVTANLSMGTSEQNDTNGYDNIILGPKKYSLGLFLGGLTGSGNDTVATEITKRAKSESTDATLRFDVSGESVDFSSITSIWDYSLNGQLDLDGTSAHALGFIGFPQEADSFSQELQWQSTAGDNIDWIGGLFYYEQSTSWEGQIDRSDTSAAVGGPPFLSQGYQNADTTAYAGFGQLTYHFNDSWDLTLGGRYNYEEKDVVVRASKELALTTSPPMTDTVSWNEFTPKATLAYNFDAGMAYLTYARGFKSGGFNYVASAINPLTGAPEPAVNPEILDMIEAGWKTQLADDTVRFNGSIYFYDYKDLQVSANVTSASGAQANITRNAADAEIIGLDMDLTWILNDRLTLDTAVNFMDSEYTEYFASAQMFNGVIKGNNAPGMTAIRYDASGESLLRAPDLSAYMTLTYELPVSSGRSPISITYSYKGDYKFDFVAAPETSALEQDAYALINARWSYYSADESWMVAVWGKNLTDEDEYYDDINANPAGIRGSVGTPRTFGIDVSYEF
jgi:iron complex outermembrane receptor protein